MSYSTAMLDVMLGEVSTRATTIRVINTEGGDITSNFAAGAAGEVTFGAPQDSASGREIRNSGVVSFGKANGAQSVGAYSVRDADDTEIARVNFALATLINNGDGMSADVGDIRIGLSNE